MSKRKKILITMTSLFLGGAETSLLGLLDSIDYDRYDVDLFLFRREGELVPLVNDKVNILPEKWQYTCFDTPIVSLLKGKKILFAIARLLAKLCSKIDRRTNGMSGGVWRSLQFIYLFINPLLPKIEGNYDIALSFFGVPFYMSKIDAKVKLAWVHTDYSTLAPNKYLDRLAFSRVDKVVNVSEDCARAFEDVYPEFSDKSVVIENIISERIVDMRKSEFSVKAEMPDDGCVKILSVGRITYAKNFDNVPAMVKIMLDKGLRVKWYIVGAGDREEILESRISQFGVSDSVIRLGGKTNPYPYMLECDIYCQPSRFEGKCVAVREAQMLGKPVMIANYTTSSSQLEDGVDGIIAPQDNEGFSAALCRLIDDKDKQKMLAENTKLRDYTNSSEVKKIYSLIQ